MSDRTERNCDKCIHHTSGNCDSWDCKMQTVEDVKKEAVNEYVKSVVAELEENASRYTKKYLTPYGNNGYRDTKAISIHKAIEIVKHVGVSDDVCQWEQSGDMAINPHTFSKYKIKQCAGVYALNTCPYCGKKIKVEGYKNGKDI